MSEATRAPEGHGIVIEGTVLCTDVIEGSLPRWNPDRHKERYVMTVQSDEGWTTWGTEPAAINCVKGDRVRFVANLTRSDEDESFAFFGWPRKAEIL